MSAVFLTLAGALASVLPVRGTSRCPTPAAVTRQLGPLTARARARGHLAEVDSNGDRVRLRLLDSAGHLLAQRWLRTAEGCEGRAKAAAVVLATLELEPKSEPALLPPAPAPQEEPPAAVAPAPPEPVPPTSPPPEETVSPQPTAPQAPPPPEALPPEPLKPEPLKPEPPKPEPPPAPPEPPQPIEQQLPQAPPEPQVGRSAPVSPALSRRPWQVDAAVEGSMTSDVTWTLGGELGASVTPLNVPLAFRLALRVEGERAVGLAPGSVAYSRQGLGLGLAYPFQVGPFELSLEAQGLAALALIRTNGFSRLGSDQEIDPGVGVGVRFSRVFSWGSLFAGLWPTVWLVSDRVAVSGAGAASLPQIELFLGLGVASPRL